METEPPPAVVELLAEPLDAALAEIEVELADVIEKFNAAFGEPVQTAIPAYCFWDNMASVSAPG